MRRIPTSQLATADKRVVARAPPHGSDLDAILYISDLSQASALLVEPTMAALHTDGSVEPLVKLSRNSLQIASGSRVVWGVNERGPWAFDVDTKVLTQLATQAPLGGARFYASDGSRLVLAFETANHDWEIEEFSEGGTRTVLKSPPPKAPVQAIDVSGQLTCIHYLEGADGIPVMTCTNPQGGSFDYRFKLGDEFEPAGNRLFVTSSHVAWSSLRFGWVASRHGKLEPKRVEISTMVRFAGKDPCGLVTGPMNSLTGEWSFVSQALDSFQPIPVPASASVDTSIASGVSNEPNELAILKREAAR